MKQLILRNILCLQILLLLTNAVIAQEPCNDEVIMAVKGKWTIRPNAEMNAGNSQAIIRIDKMQKILQAAYPELKGIEAKWNRIFGKNPLVENGPAPYQLQSAFFSYYCNKNVNKMRLGGETATWFYVDVNHFNWFLDEVKEYKIQNQPVYLLRKKAGEIKGYPVYEGNYNQRSNTGMYYSRAIILKPARMFLSNNTAQVLEQPAILDHDNRFQFKAFAPEEKGGMLVRLNPIYFDMKLPKYIPQFLVAYWRWDVGTLQNYWRDQIEKNFDFDALKAMIDK